MTRAVAAALLAACAFAAPAAEGPGATGVVQVRVHDHRDAIADFARLEVLVEAIEVHSAGAPRNAGWISLPARGEAVDLTQHLGPPGAVVAEGPVPARTYDAVRLTMGPLQGALKAGGAASVNPPAGAVAVRFALRPGATIALLADLTVMDLSDHPGGGYEAHIQRVTVAPASRP